MRWNVITPHGFVVLLFLLATVFITYPLPFHLGELTVGHADELLISWIHNWNIQALAHNPSELFHAATFYPYQNTLAYSDLFVFSSILSYLPVKIIGEPIVYHTFSLIASLFLLGVSIYALSYYLTKNIFVSFLSGILLIFSPVVIDKFVHIQMLTVFFVPLSLLFLLHFVKTGRYRFLVFYLTCLFLQTINSFLPGYFIVFSSVIILIWYWFQRKKLLKKRITKKAVLLIIGTITILSPFVLSYYSVSKEFSYVRDIRDTVHLALQPEDLFYPNKSTRLQSFLTALQSSYPKEASLKVGYMGAMLSILSLLAMYFVWKRRVKVAYPFLSIGFVGLVLSLGPVLHLGRVTVHKPFLIPLPYSVLYYLVPGFQGFRNSSRWEMLFVLMMVVVIGIVLAFLFKRVSFKKQLLITILLTIGVVGEYNFPMQFFTIPQKKDFPKEYHWLVTTPKDSVFVEMPIYTWRMQPYANKEFLRLYYNTVNSRRTLNGTSGFSPPKWEKNVSTLLAQFPNEQSVNQLRMQNIDYVLVHKDEYNLLSQAKFAVEKSVIPNGETVIEKLRNNKAVTLIKQFNNTYIYKL